jgi:radical SAM superfamily enzyme YgiQ (UPF0313 family)
MQLGEAVVTVQHQSRAARLDGTHVRFSAHKCIRYDDGPEDRTCVALLADACATFPRIAAAVDDGGRFLAYLLKHEPALAGRIVYVTQPCAFGDQAQQEQIVGRAVVAANDLGGVDAILLADTRAFPRMQMRRRVPPGIAVIDPDVIVDTPDRVPARAWIPWSRDVIYPIDVPDIEVQPNLDILVIDCPARNLGLMPNGLGYVHNALKHTSVRFQTLDLDIIIYHRFHVRRLVDEGGTVTLATGRVLPTDPWQAEHYDFWAEPDTLTFMAADIDEIVAKIVAARPTMLGLSIQSCNEAFSTRVVEGVRRALPDIVVVVGGFSCYNADIGLSAFPPADYMCIGEADLTVGALVERLALGERPANVPGVVSKRDDPSLPFIPAPMPHDLDLLDHPQYEWYDLNVYRNYNGYQLTPVIASRGCRWSRCTFCAERFYWRIRSAGPFVDELEWLVDQGCHLFMFNESDLNGMPEKVLEICDEVIRRKLNIKLTGQLRIHKKSDRAYFQKLREAGFVALRFGVDAFSENTLRLQKKGYTKDTVRQNLRDCWEAGIYTEVNWVIGVPGETDADVKEGIDFILENKKYIGRLANFNPLILVNGGVYWLEPDKHNIVFREEKNELMTKYRRAIPAHLWYSTDPYIDELVRKRWFEEIVVALHEGGFEIGPWAARIIEDVQKARDRMRSGDRAAAAAHAATEAAATGMGEESGAGLSAGVGQIAEPDPADSTLEFNPDARSSAYVFKAGSILPADRVARLEKRVVVVPCDGELYAFDPAVLTDAFGSDVVDLADSGTTHVASHLRILGTVGKGAVPQLLRTIGTYNVVQFDGYFYGIPHSFGAIEWGTADLTMAEGVFMSHEMREIVQRVERIQGIDRTAERLTRRRDDKRRPTMIPLTVEAAPAACAVPVFMATVESYNIVEYEGWFYGLPLELGDIDLAVTDVVEMPGVIRDLSRDVVEHEIREVCGRAAVSG